jgi:hypothetical protein
LNFLVIKFVNQTQMTSKQWTLVMVALVAAGICLYFNRDWFASEHIQISHRARAGGLARFRKRPQAQAQNAAPLMFEFDRKLKLTSVQVLPVSDIETNKYPQPIWHLVSDSNSVPTKGFQYGIDLPGMRPARKGVVASPIEPGIKYRLLIQAGSLKASHDFALEPAAQ